MKTLIIGLGNPILRDDGIGIRVAQMIKKQAGEEDVEVIELSVGGLRLIEEMSGHDKAIIIDAIITGENPPGSIHKLNINDLSVSLHTSSTHDTNLVSALEIGKKLGIKLPSEIIIYGIEAVDVNNFGEDATEAVNSSIPIIAEMVLEEHIKFKN